MTVKFAARLREGRRRKEITTVTAVGVIIVVVGVIIVVVTVITTFPGAAR